MLRSRFPSHLRSEVLTLSYPAAPPILRRGKEGCHRRSAFLVVPLQCVCQSGNSAAPTANGKGAARNKTRAWPARRLGVGCPAGTLPFWELPGRPRRPACATSFLFSRAFLRDRHVASAVALYGTAVWTCIHSGPLFLFCSFSSLPQWEGWGGQPLWWCTTTGGSRVAGRARAWPQWSPTPPRTATARTVAAAGGGEGACAWPRAPARRRGGAGFGGGRVRRRCLAGRGCVGRVRGRASGAGGVGRRPSPPPANT